MASFYVGNATKHDLDFGYRLPESKSGMIIVKVKMGQQMKLTGNLSVLECDAIIEQYKIYGIKNVNDMNLGRGEYNGIIYSIDKPITMDKIRRAMDRNVETLEEQGKKQRMEAAIATNANIETNIGTPLRELEMSVAEIEPPQGFGPDAGSHVAEGVRVNREAEQGGPKVSKRGRR